MTRIIAELLASRIAESCDMNVTLDNEGNGPDNYRVVVKTTTGTVHVKDQAQGEFLAHLASMGFLRGGK